ncbi:MAG: hypothetical protein CL923_08965 [Deltaproteobacteria bacterium]|nr:hypothetical protein [Deltaproteobacteria bacterium]
MPKASSGMPVRPSPSLASGNRPPGSLNWRFPRKQPAILPVFHRLLQHLLYEYDPMLVMACHCKTCIKISGVGLTVFAVYGEGEVGFEGDFKTYPCRGERGNFVHQGFCSSCGNNGERGNFVHQGFCSSCGNNIAGRPAMLAGMLYLHIGSFKNPQAFTPRS